jgi:hypothetical protein
MRLGLANCDGAERLSCLYRPKFVDHLLDLSAEARSSNEVEDCLPSSRYSTCM